MDDEKRVSSEAESELAKKNAEAEMQARGMAEGGAREFEALIAENQALRAQAEEVNDRNLRLVAEMENLRRRTERDKSEFAKYAISEFARDVLTVGDNLRRAIEALPKDAMVSNPGISALIEGVEVTERELLKVLERFQVKRFDPLGEPFNPHLHEAMTKVDVPNVPADTVIQTIHAGYMIGDRVLRPAAVIVAKGGAVAEPQQQRASDKEETLPPGAMRVPNDAVSSGSGQQRGGETEAQFRARQQGGNPQDPRRPGNEQAPDERVASFRRARQAGAGGGGAAGPDNQRQQNPNRPSTLHKPVIGGGGKQEW
jgi:molecular chaperone GrpE (heat shock protein)